MPRKKRTAEETRHTLIHRLYDAALVCEELFKGAGVEELAGVLRSLGSIIHAADVVALHEVAAATSSIVTKRAVAILPSDEGGRPLLDAAAPGPTS